MKQLIAISAIGNDRTVRDAHHANDAGDSKGYAGKYGAARNDVLPNMHLLQCVRFRGSMSRNGHIAPYTVGAYDDTTIVPKSAELNCVFFSPASSPRCARTSRMAAIMSASEPARR